MAPKIVLLIISGLILQNTIFASLKETIHRRRILESTVVITIIVPEFEQQPAVDEALPIPPDEYRPIAKVESYKGVEGLGTLANIDGEIMIITHDHWSVLENNLGTVQVRNATGQMLAETQLLSFKKRIQYHDGGTMILEAPKEIITGGMINLSWLTDNPAGSQESASGDAVLKVYRRWDCDHCVSIMEAKVERTDTKLGQPIVRLQSSGGESIVPGDSGGGVWLDGNFVGNTWTTIMMEGQQTGLRQQSDLSIAALYPNMDAMSIASLEGGDL
jgi:hypothetical protein